jgi:predicted Holliday junction resolvase-like endonuclease
VKLLFHPIDYVAFRGLTDGRCTAVEFLDREPDSARHEKLQRSIDTALRSGNVEWVTMRIADDGKVTCS